MQNHGFTALGFKVLDWQLPSSDAAHVAALVNDSYAIVAEGEFWDGGGHALMINLEDGSTIDLPSFSRRGDPFAGKINSSMYRICIILSVAIAVVGDGERQEFVMSAGRGAKDGVESTEKLNLEELAHFEVDIDYPGGEIVGGASVNLE